ncbi:DUF4044 domain-containing protein [Clostridium estertheticum]|nr:DUF4044 domain-containing protein [Clostridium estertheticum]MBU3074011.1 DUF4044 domain-containing protein [Clostridium estertheticum]MBU3164105.1 DUF4044 domain-containing protein [Clostridium estertheticum]MBU3170041.1 DUF4044 domain-containing protein [Clostridium estertheticum]MBZ9617184.1 DUF4044 domain-containing protein [Clostridium estertheticum subsp. laramiense]WAG72876.1 DUF4044 domain-containing protein [Clostridium estertheticum]
MKKQKREKYTKVMIYAIVVIFMVGFVLPVLFK